MNSSFFIVCLRVIVDSSHFQLRVKDLGGVSGFLPNTPTYIAYTSSTDRRLVEMGGQRLFYLFIRRKFLLTFGSTLGRFVMRLWRHVLVELNLSISVV